MSSAGTADILVSFVSPLIGLLLVAAIFWLNTVSENPPETVWVFATGIPFILAWLLGSAILWIAADMYLTSGAINSDLHFLILLFIFILSIIAVGVIILGLASAVRR